LAGARPPPARALVPGTMLLRLRSRDGTERVEVPDGATVGQLKRQVESQLGVKVSDQTLSLNQGLLMAKLASAFTDLSDDRKSLKSAGLSHGTMVYLKYDFEREVAQAVKPSTSPFGKKMTVEDLEARRTMVERQETAACSGASFDRHAANQFQLYVGGTLTFTVGRCGLLYGTVDGGNKVSVEAIYEPPQEGSVKGFSADLAADAPGVAKAEQLAEQLGLRRVGFIFAANAKERGDEYTISADELVLMARLQAEGGPHFVHALVAEMETDDGPAVNFEAFQCSDQCVQMYKDGFFVPGENPAAVKLKENAEVYVMRKEVEEVDNELFLVPVPIMDHEGPLKASFPPANRLIEQTTADLRGALQKGQRLPFVERIADFHLLLHLAESGNLDQSDIALLADCVRTKTNVQDGYVLIINSIAGIDG